MDNPYMHLSAEQLKKMIADAEGQNNPYMDMSADELRARILAAEGNEAKISRPMGEAALRQGKRILRAGATGIASLADIPNLAAMGAHAVGVKETPTFYKPFGQRTQESIDEWTGGELKPENKAEEYMDIVGEGLAPIALAPLTGGASLTGVAARAGAKGLSHGVAKKGLEKLSKLGTGSYAATGSNVAGNVGSSVAMKKYLDEVENTGVLGSLGAGIVGGLSGRAGLNIVKNPKNAASKAAMGATRYSPEKHGAYLEAGVPASMGDVSRSSVPSFVETIGAKLPGSMGEFEKFHKLKESAIAKNLGIMNPEDLEHAVSNPSYHLAKKGAEGYHAKVSKARNAKQESVDDLIRNAINNEELVDITKLKDVLDAKKDLSLTPQSRVRFDKSKDGRLRKDLYESLVEKNKAGLHDIIDLRKKAQQEAQALVAPTGKKTVASVEASARERALRDLETTFVHEKGTPQQVYDEKSARKIWARYKDQKGKKAISDYVGDITGAADDADAFNKLTNDATYLEVVRKGLPKEDRPKLFESIVANMGKRQGRFNMNTFHTDYVNAKPAVRNEILKTVPSSEARKGFEQTMKLIGDNKRKMEKLANTSGTAHTNEMISLLKKYGVAATNIAVGSYTAPISLGVQYGLSKLGAKLWTDQKFLERMHKISKTKSLDQKNVLLEQALQSARQRGQQSKETNKKIPIINVGKMGSGVSGYYSS